ncbi:hypothetical protein PHYBLDRAFT_175189 [Phycomyces blakesleeanus NRRL 1555(-)]|uniref:Uncharacterized protein n=1 Tax=Phycomyces blakesleeanus (strain ATCC 8743b / DSM 1359 / FGSC 10004 / NBRC 33097 / NRRL 1555) TaxID=763407 RepID=A0A167JNP3_PHYB8|nr:hypothetical protein PHYBLDRAFT_175189 [Phycomyces blakesleeanus NRRL 1555(-)]OAD66377.1 hypothetical protein PHYBLDRAFT_175189 [Phycomyces blakesleeanus NRRL 1555(-)]|eukprot:XP_018284417.1 hypothetical protein PHYBLDRAFT_175189 [Phycomyces blakesleeanus NRRL 1555(-)]
MARFATKDGKSKETYAGHIKYIFVHDFSPQPTATNFFHYLNSQHYKAPYHQLKTEQGMVLCEPTFVKYNSKNILPVHCILLSVAIGDHVSDDGTAKVIVISLPRKLYA